MPKHIIWSPLSETDLEKVLIYLEKKWNKQVATKFLDRIEIIINQIAINPKQFPLINKKKKIRKCVVTKQNSIFYRENKEFIELLRIFDTRMSFRKRKYE